MYQHLFSMKIVLVFIELWVMAAVVSSTGMVTSDSALKEGIANFYDKVGSYDYNCPQNSTNFAITDFWDMVGCLGELLSLSMQ